MNVECSDAITIKARLQNKEFLFITVSFKFLLKNSVSYHPKVTRRQCHSAGPENEKARSANFVRSLGFE